MKIPIESLVTGYGQVVDESRVEYYVKHLDEADPIVVFRNSIETVLADGHHRVIAASRLGRLTIEADVRPGDRWDALRYSDQRGRSI